MGLNVNGLCKSYNGYTVLKDFSARFEGDTVTAVLGASGSGKTTLLNCVAGILPCEGSITAQGDISYIFQKERLIPNLTVAKNIEFVLADKYPRREQREDIVKKYLSYVKLSDWADKYPSNLSGGMQQRVSMARAFAYPSGVLLMDEPFKSLDIGLKMQLLQLFVSLMQQKPRTVLFVTHDIDEALLISDRIIVLDGSPAKIALDEQLNEEKGDRQQYINSGGYEQIKSRLLKLLGAPKL